MKQAAWVLLLVLIFACSKEDRYKDACDDENPFEMEWFAEWISDLHNCSCIISIFQAEYEGEPVFWELITDPLCQSVIENITIYCCTGCELTVLNDYNDLLEFQKKVSNIKIIYNCPTPNKLP